MSLEVKLSLAEHFLNWYTDTKLYIRGQRGKDWDTQRALDKELFDQLCTFFDRYGVTEAMRAQDRIKEALVLLEHDSMCADDGKWCSCYYHDIRAALTGEDYE